MLETNLFRLASCVGARPTRAKEFAAIANRLRSAVKRQSEHWDMAQPEARQTIYRQLFGARMALEEILLQAGANGTNHTNSPDAASPPDYSFPTLITSENEPSQTPAAKLLGLTLHSGDLLVSRGGAPTSALIARGNDYPGGFSHVALLHVDEKTGQARMIESHIERGVAIAPFAEYLADPKLRIMVLRLRAGLPALTADPLLPHKAAAYALDTASRRHIPYDFAMDGGEHTAQFCSEVVAAAYEKFGVHLWTGTSYISSPTVTAWLGSVGVRFFETQLPADLEYDPQVQVVAEWREPATLLKAHIDDAVTDAMLEAAPLGQPLPINRSMLPLTRIAKVYSVVLNWFGAVGPVPEGMSAVRALRADRYRGEHDAIAARVLVAAAQFQRDHGYTPPYWVLYDLAKKATSEVLGHK